MLRLQGRGGEDNCKELEKKKEEKSHLTLQNVSAFTHAHTHKYYVICGYPASYTLFILTASVGHQSY